MTNSITEISEVSMQLLEFRVTLHLHVWQYAQGSGCTRHSLIQHRMNLGVLSCRRGTSWKVFFLHAEPVQGQVAGGRKQRKSYRRFKVLIAVRACREFGLISGQQHFSLPWWELSARYDLIRVLCVANRSALSRQQILSSLWWGYQSLRTNSS